MNPVKRRQLSSLLSKIVDGRAENIDMELLDQFLSGDGEARAYYLHYLALHSELERQGGEIEEPAQPAKHKHLSSRFAILTAAACLLLAAVGTFLLSKRPSSKSPALPAARPYQSGIEDQPILAVIGNVDQAEWSLADPPPRRGAFISPGVIRLTSGIIRLDFHSGEKITIEAPARFELIDTKRLKLDEGALVASTTEGDDGFTVMMPGGAAVTLGTDFAVSVTRAGQSHIHVIKGMVMASSTNEQGNTSWQRLLEEGDEYLLTKSTPPKKESFRGQIPIHLGTPPVPLHLDAGYSDAVLDSKPIAYWRFDVSKDARTVPSEVGSAQILLGGAATIDESGALSLDGLNTAYAISSEAFSELNASNGCSVELWAISNSVEWQSLAGLVLEGPRPKHLRPSFARHSPHVLLMERAGIAGSKRHHIHPNFALRSVYHSPLSYIDGVNAYSNADYLIHEWHHLVVVKEAGHLKIYVDGSLSGSTPSPSGFDTHTYKLLLGRLHTLTTQEDARPWSGAIDEVSLYDYALDTGTIKAHHEASGK